MTATTSTLSVKDGNGVARLIPALDQSAGAGSGPFIPQHALIDQNGNQIAGDSAGRLLTKAGGSVGVDYSVNAPTWPNVVANFGGSGAFANYQLAKTIAAGPNTQIEVMNCSTANVLLLLDDGTAAGASAPVNATGFVLAPAEAADQQGGDWQSLFHQGRIQVYMPTAYSGYVAIRANS
jgi:hypothetical protein